MKTKNGKSFMIILIIAGIGALWLSFCWRYLTIHPEYMRWDNDFPEALQTYDPITFYYYLINSIVLICSGIALLLKKYKLHAILSILLAFSILMSLFIIGEEKLVFGLAINNLFIRTTLLGFFAISYGGTLLVPGFLFMSYMNVLLGIRNIKNGGREQQP